MRSPPKHSADGEPHPAAHHLSNSISYAPSNLSTPKKREMKMPNSNTPNPFALPPIPSRRVQRLNEGVAGCLYVAGGTATRDFLQPLGVTGFKYGLTSRRTALERILDLRRKRYGAIVADKNNRDVTILDHARGDEWFISPLEAPANDPEITAALATIPQGEIAGGVVSFRLPFGVDLASLDQLFQNLMAPRNLNTFLASADGRERLQEVGLPAGARLFTDYLLMGQPRRSLASEIYLIRPRRELGVLVSALAEALRQETERLREIGAHAAEQ
jgi:hypothetical protein